MDCVNHSPIGSARLAVFTGHVQFARWATQSRPTTCNKFFFSPLHHGTIHISPTVSYTDQEPSSLSFRKHFCYNHFLPHTDELSSIPNSHTSILRHGHHRNAGIVRSTPSDQSRRINCSPATISTIRLRKVCSLPYVRLYTWSLADIQLRLGTENIQREQKSTNRAQPQTP